MLYHPSVIHKFKRQPISDSTQNIPFPCCYPKISFTDTTGPSNLSSALLSIWTSKGYRAVLHQSILSLKCLSDIRCRNNLWGGTQSFSFENRWILLYAEGTKIQELFPLEHYLPILSSHGWAFFVLFCFFVKIISNYAFSALFHGIFHPSCIFSLLGFQAIDHIPFEFIKIVKSVLPV